MSNVCVYCRVSTPAQANDEKSMSWDTQRAVCSAYAKSHKMSVKRVIQEYCSAYHELPKELHHVMMGKPKAQNVTLLFTHMDRFCRNVSKGMQAISVFLKQDKRNRLIFVENKLVVTAQEWNNYDKMISNSIRNRVQDELKACQAESERIRDRVNRALDIVRANDGFIGNHPPYGFKIARRVKDRIRHLVPVEKEQPVLDLISIMLDDVVSLQKLNFKLRKMVPRADYTPVTWYENANSDEKEKNLTYDNIALILNQYRIPFKRSNGNENSRGWTARDIEKCHQHMQKHASLHPLKRVKHVHRPSELVERLVERKKMDEDDDEKHDDETDAVDLDELIQKMERNMNQIKQMVQDRNTIHHKPSKNTNEIVQNQDNKQSDREIDLFEPRYRLRTTKKRTVLVHPSRLRSQVILIPTRHTSDASDSLSRDHLRPSHPMDVAANASDSRSCNVNRRPSHPMDGATNASVQQNQKVEMPSTRTDQSRPTLKTSILGKRKATPAPMCKYNF